MLRLLVIGGLAGCGFSAGQALDARPIDAPGDPDAPRDSSIDSPPAAACYGTLSRICLAAIPTTQLDVNNPLPIDTDNPSMCQPTATGTAVDACVIAATDITINSRIDARGSRPLVLIAVTGAITVNGSGLIDASSRRVSGTRGAGAPLTCAGGTPATGRGGGAGGSHGFPGGPGGGSGGGVAGPIVPLPGMLRGGCPGGSGGGNADSGGLGGGAVALIALAAVTINGTVMASGAGGLGGGGVAGANPQGGGGGGAGGTIWLDAPEVVINATGRLAAQGGGGGQGSAPPMPGMPGGDVTIPGISAAGGFDVTGGGGGGGPGGVSGGGGGGGGAGNAGGGGGGGGAGSVRSADPTTNNSGLSFPSPTS